MAGETQNLSAEEEMLKSMDSLWSNFKIRDMAWATRPLSKRKWFVLDFDDQPFGPFFLADVMQFIGSKALTKDSPIYDEEEGKWNSASYTFEQISQLMSFDNYHLERNNASIQRIHRVRVPDVRCAKDVIWSNIQALEVSTDDSSYVLHQENLVRTLDPQFFDLSLDSIGENDIMKLESVLEFDDIGLEVFETKEEGRVELDVCGIDMAFETLGVIEVDGMPQLDDVECSFDKMQVQGVKMGDDIDLCGEVSMEFTCIELYRNHVGYGSRTACEAMTSVEFFKLCVEYVNVEKCRMRGSCIRLHEMSMYKLVVGGIFCGVVFSIFKVDQKMLDDKEWNFKKRKKGWLSWESCVLILEDKANCQRVEFEERWSFWCKCISSNLVNGNNGFSGLCWNFKKRKKKLQAVKGPWGQGQFGGMAQASKLVYGAIIILQPPIHEGTGFGRTHWIRKQLADRNRIEKEFREGNWVFLKLHLFGQYTLLQQQSHKMFPKYCDSFQIIMRVGGVAYELNLPSSARIHNVIHVSVLKKCWASASSNPRVTSETPNCLQQEEARSYPEKFVKNGNTSRTMWLTQWRGQRVTDATWECAEEMLIRFPDFAF